MCLEFFHFYKNSLAYCLSHSFFFSIWTGCYRSFPWSLGFTLSSLFFIRLFNSCGCLFPHKEIFWKCLHEQKIDAWTGIGPVFLFFFFYFYFPLLHPGLSLSLITFSEPHRIRRTPSCGFFLKKKNKNSLPNTTQL